MRHRIVQTASWLTAAAMLLMPAATFADSVGVDFESYSLGTVNGQDGWSSLGAAGSGCALYDHAVGGSLGTTGFGAQSLRISNAVTSGCFGDQTFSKSLANEAGETSAQNGGMSGGTRETHFEAGFDFASAIPGAQQVGLAMSTSPDRGDGARMSYLRFEDQANGVHVFFDDYQDAAPFGGAVGDAAGCAAEDDFIETDIATLDRSMPHNIRFVMDFVDGSRNDVVNIYIDNALVKTGTSWEDYFRYCEGNETRTVDSLIFRTGGTAVPANAGNGFLFDNVMLVSGDAVAPTITITTPVNGALYSLGQSVLADYACDDGTGSGVATCVGPVMDGSAIDTATPGSHAFMVNATDNAGNSSSASVSYTVSSYAFGAFLAPLPKGEFKKGSTIPVKFTLLGVGGVPYGGATATLKVNGSPAVASGNSNTGNMFRYDATSGQYIFNLSTKNLPLGTNTLLVTLSDGTTQSVVIVLR